MRHNEQQNLSFANTCYAPIWHTGKNSGTYVIVCFKRSFKKHTCSMVYWSNEDWLKHMDNIFLYSKASYFKTQENGEWYGYHYTH